MRSWEVCGALMTDPDVRIYRVRALPFFPDCPTGALGAPHQSISPSVPPHPIAPYLTPSHTAPSHHPTSTLPDQLRPRSSSR